MKIITQDEETTLLRYLCPILQDEAAIASLKPLPECIYARWLMLRNGLIFSLMLDAGLRVGEAVKLVYGDCYFQDSPVKMLRLRAEITKTKRAREIPIGGRLSKVLMIWQFINKYNGEASPQMALVSAQPGGASLTVRAVERTLRSAALAAIGHPVNPHMLRHTFATKLMKITDIRTVQTLLGHKSVNTTQIYTHVNGEDLRNAIQRVDPL